LNKHNALHPEPARSAESKDAPREIEVDLLVAGAGAGGMAAALVGALEGLDVLLCEASGQVGGTSATSAGTLWIPGNRQSLAAGFSDSAADAETYLDAIIGEGTNRHLRAAFLRTGPDAIDYFAARSDVVFRPCGRHPDYRSNQRGAAVAGRAIIPEPFDGRRLGRDFERLRPPIDEFMVMGGMMIGKDDIPRLVGRFRSLGNFVHSARLLARYLADRLRFGRGTRLVMGNALVARLYHSLRERRVAILFETAIEALIGDAGDVTGAMLRSGGERIRVRVRRGVVLATGGYAHNAGFRAAFMPEACRARSMAVATDGGDGIALGQRIGARVAPGEHRSGAFWSPVSVTRRRDGSTGLFPHLVLDRAKPGLIAVNAAGRRFVNEACSYHDFVEAMLDSHKSVPTVPAYLICEAGFVRRYGLGAIHPGTRSLGRFERGGYVVCAPTIDALARRISVDAAGLRETIRRANEFARTGADLDFGKGETELNRFNGDPSHGPNPCLGPIETPPFCALAVWPAEIACSTGLATDEDARVLDGDGRPIPGLYACGNDMASIMQGVYAGPGITLGPALVFAYRLARHAAAGGAVTASGESATSASRIPAQGTQS
jgi:succinate dehydrogenase/fumarate reductase flavoprotein subunit